MEGWKLKSWQQNLVVAAAGDESEDQLAESAHKIMFEGYINLGECGDKDRPEPEWFVAPVPQFLDAIA